MKMESNDWLKLSNLTIDAIHQILTKPQQEMESGSTRLAAIADAVTRYKYYQQYPKYIPPYTLDLLKEDRKEVKYDYTYYPVLSDSEITQDKARELLDDYHTGKVELDPRMLQLVERYLKEEQK